MVDPRYANADPGILRKWYEISPTPIATMNDPIIKNNWEKFQPACSFKMISKRLEESGSPKILDTGWNAAIKKIIDPAINTIPRIF